MLKTIAIIPISEKGEEVAQIIARELGNATIVSRNDADLFSSYEALIFIGATGIAIRSIAPYIKDKHTDPAVISVDLSTRFVISLLSGHIGGANRLTTEVAHILGATPVITTRSDNESLWALDMLAKQYGWQTETTHLNKQIASFVGGKPTALLLETRDQGTDYLERTKPSHVDIYYKEEAIDLSHYELLIAVTPRIINSMKCSVVVFHPKVLNLGIGCRKDCPTEGIAEHIGKALYEKGLSPLSIRSINTIELKKEEALLKTLSDAFDHAAIHAYSPETLDAIETPNPSTKAKEATGSHSVSEASAIYASTHGALLIEKTKGCLAEGAHFTFALSQDRASMRSGHIEIVGAGPGDPELVSVRGKQFLERADLILYAGSLVPIELTHYAKDGATVRSSASMNLEEQFELMKRFYDKGALVVRLHTGDPCIYGAIQEQMALFDKHRMSYHITPGISSFQAAAAALRSQFTIPDKVQTIILTRGEGRTSMPEKEKLNLLARSQSTMCIFLSATVVEAVQRDLLEHYPPQTPVAICHKLTWRDEKIVRGELHQLAALVKENHFTLTTMIVVGEAIDNRRGLSKLYDNNFKHIFRNDI